MIIDSHVHIGLTNKRAPHADVESCIKLMDQAGVDKVVAFLYDETTLENNIRFMEMVSRYENRIIPFAWLNPKDENADEELAYCIDTLGFKGLKIHPKVDKFDLGDLNMMDKIMKEANLRKLQVIIHCTSNEQFVDTEKVEKLAQKYPDCIIQLAHIGAIYDGNKAIDVALRNENVYLDTGIASMNCIRRAVLKVPEKLLMGCDYPSYTFANEMHKIKDACILAGNKDVYKDICGHNAERIMGML